MATILALLKKIEDVNTEAICTDVIEESTGAMEVKSKEQLYSGETATGDDIEPYYKPLTISIKKEKGQPTDRVTLSDTGAFYQGIYVNVQGDKIVTGSTDTKTLKLLDKYGNDIFGLNDKFGGEVLRETIRPVFKQKIEAATGLKMR